MSFSANTDAYWPSPNSLSHSSTSMTGTCPRLVKLELTLLWDKSSTDCLRGSQGAPLACLYSLRFFSDFDMPRRLNSGVMKRVAVFGNAGGGKSTLARQLAAITG